MSTDADRWFGTHTYTGSAFDAEELVRAKRGRTVSVVIPAHDEEQTVGEVVSGVRRWCDPDRQLVDEVVVVDSHSTDGTAAVAAAAGARVVRQASVLPRLGDRPGKGEALWKSLAATRGDVLVLLDADVRDFAPAFVPGLLGPVLLHGAGFVKGCYDRPLSHGQTVLPSGGGRVTELVARPLLAAYWPELAGFVQPLAGECAATRDVLTSVPMACGYGVEIGLLVDVLERFGLAQMAQVDLGVRRHRHSTDAHLGEMALQVQQAVHRRLGRADREAADQVALTRFARPSPGAPYRPATVEVDTRERPPMAQIGSMPG